MNRYVGIIPIIIFLTHACQPDEETAPGLSVAEVKLLLSGSVSDGNLIRGISQSGTVYSIEFETGNTVQVKASLIESIELDSAGWLAVFHFTDGSSQPANFVGRFDLSVDDVKINPFLTCPLAAVAEIEMPVKGRFRVIVRGKQPGGITIEKMFDQYNEVHALPVLGLYEDYENQVEFIFVSNNGEFRCSKTLTLTTTAIPDRPALDIEISKAHESGEYSGLYFITNLRTGFDQRGEVRWYYSGEGTGFFGKVRNGNFIISMPNNLYFHEVTMTGQFVKEYHVPQALHHEIVELPSGNFLVASHSPPGPPYEDVVVEISRTGGDVVKTWDFNPILDPSRPALPSTQMGDWLHINALYYDEADNSIVISGRSQSAVVKVGYETGAIRWILSNHNHWDPAFQPYLLQPVDLWGYPASLDGMDFWPYGPHATQKLPNGNLLLYDNGDYRGFYDNPDVPQDSYTRIVEYKIDEQQKTVQLAWQFDHNKSVFTKFTGYTQNLGSTRLAAYMWVSEHTPKIIEINSSNQVIYEAAINRGKASYYRTMKIDLYSGIGS